ncbi:C69 family dipeptidase [Bifidobacterium magnum]|uniref:Dipeptidase n=1 Tax=Bifidobacterium magnum TaxID=1692 RepID=A0A087BAS0_9BIFI|nr:C69 family dipeptidase [Bifidobacterium magnum]KFI68120.1 Dipeptidase A [Bifidobacterium magnum]
MSCTTILVGKAASYDGSTIIARNDDSGSGRYDPKKFVVVTPEQQPRHYRSVLSHVEVELPDDPCQYSIVPNVLKNRGILAESGVSERNVAMSATETISVNSRVLAADPLVELVPQQGEPGDADYAPEIPGGFGEEDIITLVLPYISSAREGVVRLGKLLEQYGTYESNGVIISDVNDIWYVETIGGHHWIARRVPDDCYAVIPNQLGIDYFDMDDAFSEKRDFMCSADLSEFISRHHLGREIGATPARLNVFNPRRAFGTSTPKDHIYNTPRSWYMHRYLNSGEDWDSPQAQYRPDSNDIPWCKTPENKVTIENVDFLMSSHFEGTPYDPYGTTGTPESRHRYRPIGVNRTGQMVAMQIRPYIPEEYRSIMWIAYGSGPFTTAAPFYANVSDTPAYLRDTPGKEVDTSSLYWSNRLIAALADAHYFETDPSVEQYIEDVQSRGHHDVAATDMEMDVVDLSDTLAVRAALTAANDRMGEFLQKRTAKLLYDVLYTSSNLMHNSFKMSDHWN